MKISQNFLKDVEENSDIEADFDDDVYDDDFKVK